MTQEGEQALLRAEDTEAEGESPRVPVQPPASKKPRQGEVAGGECKACQKIAQASMMLQAVH